MDNERTYTAFAGPRRLARGPLRGVLLETKAFLDGGTRESVLLFEDDTGAQVDFDFRGTPDEVVARAMPPAPPPGPGRPRLGVISREVSLLQRHWDWLEAQPYGISGAMRRLVEEASKREPDKERARLAVHAASRVMTVLAGNRPGYEEAARALFARDRRRFDALIRTWPKDIKSHLRRLVAGAMVMDDGAVAAAADPEPRSKTTKKAKTTKR